MTATMQRRTSGLNLSQMPKGAPLPGSASSVPSVVPANGNLPSATANPGASSPKAPSEMRDFYDRWSRKEGDRYTMVGVTLRSRQVTFNGSNVLDPSSPAAKSDNAGALEVSHRLLCDTGVQVYIEMIEKRSQEHGTPASVPFSDDAFKEAVYDKLETLKNGNEHEKRVYQELRRQAQALKDLYAANPNVPTAYKAGLMCDILLGNLAPRPSVKTGHGQPLSEAMNNFGAPSSPPPPPPLPPFSSQSLSTPPGSPGGGNDRFSSSSEEGDKMTPKGEKLAAKKSKGGKLKEEDSKGKAIVPGQGYDSRRRRSRSSSRDFEKNAQLHFGGVPETEFEGGEQKAPLSSSSQGSTPRELSPPRGRGRNRGKPRRTKSPEMPNLNGAPRGAPSPKPPIGVMDNMHHNGSSSNFFSGGGEGGSASSPAVNSPKGNDGASVSRAEGEETKTPPASVIATNDVNALMDGLGEVKKQGLPEGSTANRLKAENQGQSLEQVMDGLVEFRGDFDGVGQDIVLSLGNEGGEQPKFPPKKELPTPPNKSEAGGRSKSLLGTKKALPTRPNDSKAKKARSADTSPRFETQETSNDGRASPKANSLSPRTKRRRRSSNQKRPQLSGEKSPQPVSSPSKPQAPKKARGDQPFLGIVSEKEGVKTLQRVTSEDFEAQDGVLSQFFQEAWGEFDQMLADELSASAPSKKGKAKVSPKAPSTFQYDEKTKKFVFDQNTYHQKASAFFKEKVTAQIRDGNWVLSSGAEEGLSEKMVELINEIRSRESNLGHDIFAPWKKGDPARSFGFPSDQKISLIPDGIQTFEFNNETNEQLIQYSQNVLKGLQTPASQSKVKKKK